MAGPVKSQWDFGELFPAEQLRKVHSVSELTAHIKRLLEKHVGMVWVGGEISNLRTQASGHVYFTLKDAGAQLSCVLFRTEATTAREALRDGLKVVLQGEITVYEARGQYQIIVREIELQGVGALQIAFEKLKQKLAAQGWFDPERKRPLPRFPQRIGLITSPTGAALRDVLHVVQRRNPALEIILVPCRVQGEGAGNEIADAVRLLNTHHASCPSREETLDLILVTRGGGSLEDLWAFNEEVVAQAVIDSALPVVSAVGHEIDFTICDFVADLRTATPSAAAEVITEDVFASRDVVAGSPLIMGRVIRRELERTLENLSDLLHRLHLARPKRRFVEWSQRLDDAQSGLLRCTRQMVRRAGVDWRNLAGRLLRTQPRQWLRLHRETLNESCRRMIKHGRLHLREQLHQVESWLARLRLLGPEQVLSRGYSITMDEATGKVLRDAAKTKPGQHLRTRLKSGEVQSVVDSATPAQLQGRNPR